MANKSHFEWDERKNQENQEKHGILFNTAQYAFADKRRIILEDLAHGGHEKRYYMYWQNRQWYLYGKIYISKEHYSHLWCGILEKGEKTI